MKRIVFYRIFLSTFLFSILLAVINCNGETNFKTPRAEKGILDLTSIKGNDWDKKIFILDGDWLFFWKQFIDPNSTGKEIQNPVYIPVPSQWQQLTNENGENYPPYGFASYQLRILLPKNHPNLSMSLTDTGTSYEIYINGVLLGRNGKPGKSKEETQMGQRYQILPIQGSEVEELNIVIYNANFEYHIAGVWDPLWIGSTELIERKYFNSIAIDLIVSSALFFAGIYHLGLYFNRRKEVSPLLFGLLCLVVMIRTLTIKERLIFELSENLPYLFVRRLEFLSFYLGGSVFFAFVNEFFIKDSIRKIHIFLQITLGFATLITIFLPLSIYARTLIPVQMIIVIGIIYTLYVLIRAIWNKQVGARSFFFGLIFFFTAVIHDILVSRDVLHSPLLSSYGILFFVISQAIVLSKRFASSFVLAENLSNELKLLNENLEEKISDRTKELKKALSIIHKDLSIAKRIQKISLFIDEEKIEHFEISPYYVAMSEVGGDFYSVNKTTNGNYHVFLADVTGHGVQAALITMALKGIYDNLKNTAWTPREILEKLNVDYYEKYHLLNSYLTCILIEINPKEQIVTQASAGHPDCLFFSEEKVISLHRTGRMIGISSDSKYEELRLPYKAGDRIFLYSDGIFEQFDSYGKDFGETRVQSIFLENKMYSIKENIDQITKELENFLGSSEKQDDITIIGIEFNS